MVFVVDPPAGITSESSGFHASDIRPAILKRHYPTIIEIGVHQGGHTRLLLNAGLLRFGRVIGIDPHPQRGIANVLRFHPCGRLIRDLSLNALPSLIVQDVKADIVIVDGDHNYYTVYHELLLIAQLLKPDGVVFLHDVSWPYGRRDMYYDPLRIPAEHRHPYRYAGLVRGQSTLADSGAFNSHLANALHEGGPKNGVLTAIEDFLEASPEEWHLTVRNVDYGLGVLRRRRIAS
jgi:hypothetical protein